MSPTRRDFLWLASLAPFALTSQGCEGTGVLEPPETQNNQHRILLPDGTMMALFVRLTNQTRQRATVLDVTRAAYHVRMSEHPFVGRVVGGLAVTLSMREEVRPSSSNAVYAADGDLLFLIDGKLTGGETVHAGTAVVHPGSTVSWYQRFAVA